MIREADADGDNKVSYIGKKILKNQRKPISICPHWHDSKNKDVTRIGDRTLNY